MTWSASLAAAVRDPDELLIALGLDRHPDATRLREAARAAARTFGLMVPRSYLAKMTLGDPADPLLRQVLPLAEELESRPGFTADAVGDGAARAVPGLLHKYAGRALLITTGACAVHCRYCFRRHYPYSDDPKRLADWQPALEYIAADATIHEVLLSGGDPLMLTDARLGELLERLAAIPHLTRLRLHTRLPVVLPDRVTPELIALLKGQRLTTFIVIHANHARELTGDAAEVVRTLVTSGFTVLNQAVLLRGVNDDGETLRALSERLVDLGVVPYYLHQLDRVAGTHHFEVTEDEGRALLARLPEQLPGYAIPKYVLEEAGEMAKTPV
jgi:EF-P beta-lysylation protein EpmB